MRSAAIGGWLLGIIFVGFWSALTLGFDCVIVAGMVRSAQAQHWPTVSGRVTHAEIKTHSGGESGTSYNAKIDYIYTVDGRQYTSQRVHFGMNNAMKKAADAAMQKYAVGTPVTVHYDPRDPSSAVLETTVLAGPSLFGLLFMVPFNVVMLLMGWGVGWLALRRGVAAENESAGSAVQLIDDASGVTRLRLTRMRPVVAAMIAAGATAFALVFVIAIATGIESLNAVAAGWAVIVGVSVIAYHKMRQRIASGWYDLLIDDRRRAITLPPKVRPEGGEFSFDDVVAVDVETKVGTGDDSDQFLVRLKVSSGDLGIVLTQRNRAAAEALARYLRRRLGIDGEGASMTPITTAGSARSTAFGSPCPPAAC